MQVGPPRHETETIDHEQQMIRDGCYFFIRDFFDIDKAATPITRMMFRTPQSPTVIKARFLVDAEAEFEVVIFEDPTITGDGAPMVPQAANRNASYAPLLTAFSGTTVSDSGDRMWGTKIGSGKDAIGISPGFGYDIHAKFGTEYLFEITKVAEATHWINLDFFWYEENVV